MKQFYVYGIFTGPRTEDCVYVGKGHRDLASGYDRIRHYAPERIKSSSHLMSRQCFVKLRHLIDAGKTITAKVMCECRSETASFIAERCLIRHLKKTHGLSLVNATSGGHSGWTLSEEARRKMSVTRTGRKNGPMSPDHRASLARAAKIRASDPAWREAHSQRMAGRTLTEDHRRKISLGNTGKGRPEGHALNRDEAVFMGFQCAGTYPLNQNEFNRLRSYRYKSDRGLDPTAPSIIEKMKQLRPEVKRARRNLIYKRSRMVTAGRIEEAEKIGRIIDQILETGEIPG